MGEKIVLSTLFGGLTLVLWAFIVNGMLGFGSNLMMKQIANENTVYEVLRENIREPGRYVCNPPLNLLDRYPEGEPVFSISYSGFGHEAAGREMLIGMVLFFLAPGIAAWLLTRSGPEATAGFGGRILFFAGIGLLIAFFADLAQAGIGGYPYGTALLLALNRILQWTAVGLVVARIMRPGPVQSAAH
ncbi:hypothetical protein JXO52_10815 [bacterium]|nr:hypothetical protein [bacterium]